MDGIENVPMVRSWASYWDLVTIGGAYAADLQAWAIDGRRSIPWMTREAHLGQQMNHCVLNFVVVRRRFSFSIKLEMKLRSPLAAGQPRVSLMMPSSARKNAID
jgi:hypothetical protein